MMFGFLKNGHILPPEFIQEAMKENEHTPDMASLSLASKRLVLVVDPQMKELIKEKPEHNPAAGFTVPRFTVLKKSILKKECFPIPLEDKYPGAPYAPVKGLVYLVEPEVIFELDKLRLNGVQFFRKRVNVHIPFYEERVVNRRESIDFSDKTFKEKVVIRSKQRLGTIRAWMYIGRPEYWNEAFQGTDGRYYGFQPVRTFELKKPYLPETISYPDRVRYYCFTPMEYND